MLRIIMPEIELTTTKRIIAVELKYYPATIPSTATTDKETTTIKIGFTM